MIIHTVSTSRWPSELADSRILVKMSDQWVGLGCQVNYIVPRRSQINQSKVNTPWYFYQIKPHRLDVIKLPAIKSKIFEYFHLGYMTFTYSFLISYLLYLLAHRPQIIYCYQKEFLLLKKLLPSIIFISEFHDIPTDGYQKLLHSLTKDNIDLWVVPNHFLCQYLVNQNISSDKIIIHPAGYDSKQFSQLNKYKIRKRLKLPYKSKIIGYIGNLIGKEGDRGVNDLLEAFTQLSKKIPNLLLICVGGQKKISHQFHQRVKKTGMIKQVKFIPHVNHLSSNMYLKTFDICVLPFPDKPHYRYFMSPMKMIEYMAAKKPIVTTDLPSIRELLDSSSAIFAKPSNPSSLAKGLQRALDTKTTSPLVKNAYQKVKKYTWKHRALLVIKKVHNL